MELKNLWCIVTYVGYTPFYYCGYYKKVPLEDDLKPVLSSDFNDALKLYSKNDAQKILNAMQMTTWKVEEHAYF